MRYLLPAARDALAPIAAAGAVLTDVFRSMASSLVAAAAKRGVQPPGYSAHNFGLAVDLDVSRSMKRLEVQTKPELDARMRRAGWWCYRSDGTLQRESWHYTWGAEAPGAGAIEATIQRFYGGAFQYDSASAQEYLARLRLYDGTIDGKLGPQSRQAVVLFQRQWKLPEDGKLDAKTKRLLAVASAHREAAER